MKNIYKLFLVHCLILLSSNIFSQFAEQVTNFPFIAGPSVDIVPQCTGGILYDDNSFENGYGWSLSTTDGRLVQLIRPPSYPFVINQLCFAFTRLSTATPDWTFDIIVYDTTGTNGYPGNLIVTIANQTAVNIPSFPNFGWFDFTGITTIPQLNSGSYYIGIKSNHTVFPSHYIGGDESITTTEWPSFIWSNSGPWLPVDSLFQNRHALGIRADGQSLALAHDFGIGPFLSMPANLYEGTDYNIKAKISNLGTANETGVLVKFFVDGALYDFVNVSLNSGATDSVSFWWTAAQGIHSLKIVTSLFNDQNRNNDTVAKTVNVDPPLPPGIIFNGCRNGLFKIIPDNLSIYDTITVPLPFNACYILDVNVKIDTVVHTWNSDLQFYLKHHGTEVNIIDRVGNSGDNFIGTILNDSASIPIDSGTAPFTGTFIPSNPLSALTGSVGYAGGPWVLRIFDGAGGDTGFLRAWCLTVTYYLCEGGIQTATIPSYYNLKQNYPNPFNPSTRIEYYIPKAGNVNITVYDVTGREINVLVNEFKNPGIYTVDFNGSHLSSGVYFYRLNAGDYTSTKKMLLVK